MAQCEVCGNEYDKAFEVTMPGGDARTFDSFECAIHALAPTCGYCNVRVIGHLCGGRRPFLLLRPLREHGRSGRSRGPGLGPWKFSTVPHDEHWSVIVAT